MLVRLGDWLGIVEEHDADAPELDFAELAPGLWGGWQLAQSLLKVRTASVSNLPIAIVGATGTGKERVARAVHAWSGRSGPFHAMNCAAVPPNLAEAELFGFRRGAFTGADRNFDGHLVAAHGGTLFLDEVTDLPSSVQAKLLRALEFSEVTPLGDVHATAFDARLVCATQRSLTELVGSGDFRNDLAARLSGLTVTLPALRARRADVPRLFSELLRPHVPCLPDTSVRFCEDLCLWSWPGNVREVEMLARQIAALYPNETLLERKHLPDAMAASRDPGSGAPAPESRKAHDLRRFEEALQKCGGNVHHAARAAGISRQRAYRLLDGAKRDEALERVVRQGGGRRASE
jgi:transcriptional regulator with PAS, ATPase and Fis domain